MMNAPMFGFGRAAETTLASGASLNATSLVLTSAAGYTVGKPVLISASNGSNIRYCGTVESVVSNTIGISIALDAGKGAGAKVWQPATYALTTVDASAPIDRGRDTGISAVQSLGGQIYQTKTREAKETMSLRWTVLADAEVRAVLTFLQSSRSDGLSGFGATWYDARSARWVVASVRYRGSSFSFARSFPGAAPLDMPLWIEALDSWVES